MKEKWLNNRIARIILSLLTGMVISAILFTITITGGLSGKDKAVDKNFTIDFLGMPIFQVVDGSASTHSGNMFFISFVISVICVFIGEFVASKMKKKESNQKS